MILCSVNINTHPFLFYIDSLTIGLRRTFGPARYARGPRSLSLNVGRRWDIVVSSPHIRPLIIMNCNTRNSRKYAAVLRAFAALTTITALTGCVGPLVPLVRLDADSQTRLTSQVKVYKVADPIEGRVSPLGSITATSCKNLLTDPSPTEEDATAQLRYRSIQAGGNAVLNVVCDSEVTNLAKNCWSSVTCRGTAARVDPSADPSVAKTESQPTKKPDSSGSGFFINREGHVLTNQHVVDDCSAIRIRAQGTDRSAKVLASDESNDLAVLQVESSTGTISLPLLPAAPRLAEPVAALGYPLPGVLSPSVGASTGTISSLAGIRGDSRFIQISAPVQPGNSGGPLVDARGAVVGLIIGKLNALRFARATGDIPQNVNFAIGLRSVQTFLEARGVSYVVADGQARDLTAAVASASPATVQVVCLGRD
jgi:S1-C subfamily serine protease